MRVCIIPAGGPQKRWAAPEPKNMTIINGKPLLVRLCEQLKPHFDKIHILAWRPEILKVFPDAIQPASLEVQQASCLATKDLWGDRTVICYGDVVMSNDARDKIVSFNGPIQFFGHYSEVVAYSFDKSMHERIAAALEESSKWTDRVWGCYRAFWGMKMRGLEAHDGGKKEFTHLTDGTSDIDMPEDLIRMYGVVKRWNEK